jgi:hypothetical protein
VLNVRTLCVQFTPLPKYSSYPVLQLIIKHTVSTTTTSKTGIKYKPLKIQGKQNIKNQLDSTSNAPHKKKKTPTE